VGYLESRGGAYDGTGGLGAGESGGEEGEEEF
jgi:hypothetical protein